MNQKITLLFFTLLTSFLINAQTSSINGISYPNLANAIFNATAGDIIDITGIHTGQFSFNKGITLRGTDPTTDILQAAATPGTAATRVLNLNTNTYNATIENLGIRNGNVVGIGGGIRINKVNGLITLSNLIIEDNNTTTNGGGIFVDGSSVDIVNCTIRNNTATTNGGGFTLATNNSVTSDNIVNIKQSLITSNNATNGGGFNIIGNTNTDRKVTVNVENTTIFDNVASSTGGNFGGGAIFAFDGNFNGSGVSNITLNLVHATIFKNKTSTGGGNNGIALNGNFDNTNFSMYNSIILTDGNTGEKALNFNNSNVVAALNNIIGGTTGTIPAIVTNVSNNNVTSQTTTLAGLSATLSNQGGKTSVLTMDRTKIFKNYCTATTGITLPTIDQRGFLRDTNPDAGAFEYYNIWTAGANTKEWTTVANWEDGLPASGDLVHIKSATKMPVSSTAIEVANIVMDSGTSFKTTSTYTGNLVYNRDLPTNNWYLVSSPVVGQDEDDFVTNAVLDYGSGTNRGLATYNTAAASNNWVYYSADTGANTLTQGVGYSIKKAQAGGVSFSGTMLTEDLAPITLATGGDGFNLLGNPYPSFINSGTFLTIPSNTPLLTSETIWIWDQSMSAYDAKPAVDVFRVAPGQGFFVHSNGTSATNFLIKENTQVDISADTFLKEESKTKINLELTSGNLIRRARLYYVDEATEGYDNGFDAPLFGGVDNPFAIYSNLVSLDGNYDLQVQSVPKANLEEIVIPIGINAAAGREITIKASHENLPEGLKIFIEDKLNNTLTELNNANSYKVTITEDLKGSGRFYLHTKSSVLSVDTEALNTVNIFANGSNGLVINGLSNKTGNIDVFNVLGSKVFSHKLMGGSNSESFQLSNVNTGVYIVKLSTTQGNLSKKIILK